MKRNDKEFRKVVNALSAHRCRQQGQTVEAIATSAKVSPRTVKHWLATLPARLTDYPDCLSPLHIAELTVGVIAAVKRRKVKSTLRTVKSKRKK